MKTAVPKHSALIVPVVVLTVLIDWLINIAFHKPCKLKSNPAVRSYKGPVPFLPISPSREWEQKLINVSIFGINKDFIEK